MTSKCHSDNVRAALMSYLNRRNYTDCDINSSNATSLSHSPEQMAVSGIIDGESGRANSILFSSINSDPAQFDQQFTRLITYIKSVEPESVQNELSGILCPLLCHMYLEMLRGGHRNQAQTFLKRHSASLPQRDFSSSMCYNHQSSDGNLPSSLYRPNSLERLFHSLQNGTIDNEIPEKDLIYQILDDLSSIFTLQDINSRPSVAAFRSCKYELKLTLEAVICLRNYLSRHSHLVLIQVLQTWFHIDINNDKSDKMSTIENGEDEEDNGSDEYNTLANNDDLSITINGHTEYLECEKELRELNEAIKSVREIQLPVKIYQVSTNDTSLICATLDSNCRNLYCGFSDSEIRVYGIQGNEEIERKRINRNISQVSFACNVVLPSTPKQEEEEIYDYSVGLCLRGHSGPVQSLKLIESAEKCGLLISVSQDTSIRAWRLSDYSCAAIYKGHNYPVWSLDIATHNIYMVSGSQDRTAKLWTLDRTYPIRIFAGHNMDVNTVKFHPNGNYIASGSADKTVRLWCVSTGQQVRLFPGHTGPVHSIAFSPDGKYIATSDDERIKIWDIADGSCIQDLTGHEGLITSLEWSWKENNDRENDSALSHSKLNGLHNSSVPSLLCSVSMDATVKLWESPQKCHPGEEVCPTTFSTSCSHLVMSKICSNWILAVGAVLV